MRGTKAKKLRAIAYQENTTMKYGHNRTYEMVKSPGQHRHPVPRTIIADDERYLYQALKGRRVRVETDLGSM